jgi:hypothetical protein
LRLKIKIKHKKVKFITEEVKTKLKKRKAGNKRTLGIVLFTVIAGLGLGVTVALATPYTPISNVYSNIRVCNGAVSQPAEYATASPNPILNWSVSSFATVYPPTIQQAFYLEIDNNNNFSSPELDTGTVNSTAHSYTVPLGSLQFNTPYYWRIGVKDQKESWTGWAAANIPFCAPAYTYSCVTTSPPACGFDDCGEQVFGSALCKKTNGCTGVSTLGNANVCESHGVTCFAPSKTCAVCPGGYKEATP